MVVVVVVVAVYLTICLAAICKLENEAILRDFLNFWTWQHERAPCFSLSLAARYTEPLHRTALVVKNSCAWPRVWAWPQCPYYVPINSQLFPHHLLWPYYFHISSHYFSAISLCFPHQFPSIFPLFPYVFPIISLLLLYYFPTMSLSFPYYFPSVYLFVPYSCPIIFPIMFLLFPYYFPIVSQSFPLISYSFNMFFLSGPY